MASFVTSSQAASQLGTSGPTVRKLIEKGVLAAERRPRGSRFGWLIESSSVEAFLATHGRYDVQGASRRVSLKQLGERLESIEELVRRLSRPIENSFAPETTNLGHLADARARIVNLEEALARSHAAEELQRETDEVRAEVMGHLLAALTSAERADGLRRDVIASLNEAVQSFSRPGFLWSVRDS